MREKTRILLSHPLLTGSTIIFAGSFISNILNYVFNLAMGRMLTVSDYGLYFTLTSIIGLFSILVIPMQNIFAKFSARYSVNDKSMLNSLIRNGYTFIAGFGLIIFVILLLLGGFFSAFLNIPDQRLLFLTFVFILISILYSMPTGILQGEMKFTFLSFTNAIIPLLKIIIGVVLVLVGFKVLGVMLSLVVAFFIPYLITSSYLIKKYKKGDKVGFTWVAFVKEFKGYSIKFFLASLGIVIISYADVILVRHFFSPQVSGQYAALSLMGKAIIYFTAPINFVFFPLIAQKREKKEKLFGTLLLAGIVIVLFSASLSFIYFLFPWLVLKVFFPSRDYAILSPYLGPYSLYILVFSIASLFSNFFLSVGNMGIYKINLAISLIFIILIFIFHTSLYQIIGILFFISFLLLVSFFIYYWYNERD